MSITNEQASLKGLLRTEEPIIETFPNQFPLQYYTHVITTDEFTSMCPKTGHPDFATVRIIYIAHERCMELKSLKLYFHDYRNKGIFYENLVNMILEDVVVACDPHRVRVEVRMKGRGGLNSVVAAERVKTPDAKFC